MKGITNQPALHGTAKTEAVKAKRVTRATASACRVATPFTAAGSVQAPTAESLASRKIESVNVSKKNEKATKSSSKFKIKVSCFDAARNHETNDQLSCSRLSADKTKILEIADVEMEVTDQEPASQGEKSGYLNGSLR